jgi:hypothetical protein
VTRARAHVRTVAILSLPLLALAVAGSARLTSGWAPVLISWALLSAAALLTFFRQEASSPAVFAWALALWLYATPVLGFLRERPDPAVGAAVLLAAAGLAAAARDVRARAWAPA